MKLTVTYTSNLQPVLLMQYTMITLTSKNIQASDLQPYRLLNKSTLFDVKIILMNKM